MLDKINLFQVASSLARHSGARQAVVAQNIANADTPGYTARDIAPFNANLAAKDAGTGMVSSRDTHLAGVSASNEVQVLQARNRAADPNKNTVSLQEEMLFGVEAKRAHDRALAIYKSGLHILRTSINGK